MSIQLPAKARENFGSSHSKKIRNENYIPAVILSKSGNVHLSVDGRTFEQEYFKGNILSSVVELDLSGKKTKVIAHKVELDPVSDRPIHVDFLPCEKSAIRAKPKLNFINQEKSPGIKKGGLLHVVERKVEVECENEASIPQKIDVDVAAMHVGQKLRAEGLKLPAKVKLLKKGNFLIASIIGRGKSEEEKTVTDAAAGTPAPGAAAAAGAPAAAAAKTDKK